MGTEGLSWGVEGPSTAPVIVMLHSLGHDRSMWEPQVEALSTSHKLILPDMRGHGGSAGAAEPTSIDDLAGDVVSIVDAEGIESFHLVGLSIGGQIAMRVSLANPERVKSLALCNTAAKIGTEEGWQDRIDAVEKGGLESIREAVIARWFAPRFPDRHPAWFAATNDAYRRVADAGYAACCRALAVSDLSGEVGSITAPTLVVGGDADVSTPPELARTLHTQIPGSSLEIIPGAGHLSNLDQPDTFTRLIREFVTTNL